MTYRNKKSGVTFTTPCVCEGEDWEEVKESALKAEVKASAPASKAKGGKKQESAADAQSADSEPADSGGEDS